MKAYICDRCGETYLKNTEHRTEGRVYGSYISGIEFISIDNERDKSMDLCDGCISDLCRFMEGVDRTCAE